MSESKPSESSSKSAPRGGLENVVAADSAIARIDGEKGELRYCGYLITDLAERSSFPETTWLLWHGELPTRAELQQFDAALRRERELPPVVLTVLREVAALQSPMDALRTVVSAMSADDLPGADVDHAVNLRRGMRLVARIATAIAAYASLRKGEEPRQPRPELGHAADFLWLLTGEVPNADVERMLDVCLVLHAEHGFNASTFAARVTAATLSDIYSAVTSAIGTLKGPLHGGANTAVMQMLLDMGSVAGVEPYLEQALSDGQKVMGFGHRVYKVMDPRALILKDFARRLAQQRGGPWFAMSEKLEALMKARKGIDVNVDFYSASTYYSLGIPPELFTTIFAMSRVSGWVAHILEQQRNNRLIRPRSNWVGAADRAYVPIERR